MLKLILLPLVMATKQAVNVIELKAGVRKRDVEDPGIKININININHRFLREKEVSEDQCL